MISSHLLCLNSDKRQTRPCCVQATYLNDVSPAIRSFLVIPLTQSIPECPSTPWTSKEPDYNFFVNVFFHLTFRWQWQKFCWYMIQRFLQSKTKRIPAVASSVIPAQLLVKCRTAQCTLETQVRITLESSHNDEADFQLDNELYNTRFIFWNKIVIQQPQNSDARNRTPVNFVIFL